MTIVISNYAQTRLKYLFLLLWNDSLPWIGSDIPLEAYDLHIFGAYNNIHNNFQIMLKVNNNKYQFQ